MSENPHAVISRIEAKIQEVESKFNEIKFDLETARVQRDNAEAKLRRVADVYQTLVDATESFEYKNFGANIAYLLGAMVSGTSAQWPRDKRNAEWWALLHDNFPQSHYVWLYVKEMPQAIPAGV